MNSWNCIGMTESCAHDHVHQLSVRDLHVHYGEICALKDLSFEAQCHRAVALVGPNGAGKSTLLKAIAGLVSNATGEILWREQPVAQSRWEIAYLPQREEVDWKFPLTVEGLVQMGRYPHVGLLRPFSKADREAVEEALEFVAMQELRHRHISQLSGGQQQRAFLARALAQESHVLLLDEPFNGLDTESRERLRGLFRTLAERGSLIIASHHDLTTLRSCFDDVLVVNQRQLAYGPVEEVADRIDANFTALSADP